jgi:RNA polymerase sigma-70 factor (ECF subfamily)
MGAPALPSGETRSDKHLFPSTHWSIVLQADGGDSPAANAALETLCRRYWYPLYGFIRRQGRTHHEAEDLAQAFFSHLLANAGIARARPARGRFRTFLLSALRNFMTNEWERARTAKRGGGQAPEPWEFRTADEQFRDETGAADLTPEQAFDRSWALGVIEQALADLSREYAASGRRQLFEALAPVVWGGGATEPLALQARRLGLNEGALKVALHRLRKRLRERLQDHVASTVADEGEIADELRYLIVAVGGKSPAV